MSRQFKNGSCSCWKKLDKTLAADTTRPTQLGMSYTLGGHEYLQIVTNRLHPSGRKRVRTVVAAFCPFCGKELKKPKNDRRDGHRILPHALEAVCGLSA